ncbi:MAG: dihydropteroate synthase [Nitrospiraceae bacterium]|jgi:dihydropteroate synthase|nr:dihydropteroate synthase [Nitrospiraceae bacterium]
MGVINVTPDSFSDGGRYREPASAVDHALHLVAEGADILDIGGESTRPGAEPVSAEEELLRTIPVIEQLARTVSVPISIDTCKAEVARRALEAGASIINDISGFRFDPDMPAVAARYQAGVCLMHIRGTPRDMQINPVYEAMIPEIMDYLRESIALARAAGVADSHIMLDPGIGFGKTFEQNLMILNRLDEFTELGYPLLVGVSRKAFLGRILGNAPVTERLEATAAAVAIAAYNGAHVVRVHDVKEISKTLRVIDAIRLEQIGEYA